MKTTIEIPDILLEEARKLATREQTTLKALVAEGLRGVIAKRQKQENFQLRRVTFRGQGLNPDLDGASWERLRNLAYEGRGG